MDLHIIIQGDLVAGIIEVIGPFGDADDAVHYAESNIDGNWYVKQLIAPDDALGQAVHRVLEVSYDESVRTDENAEDGQITTADWYYNDMQLNFARREEQGADTVTVWVTEHEDADVAWFISDRSQMKTEFDDLVEAGTVDEGQTFDDFLDTRERVEVPYGIYTHLNADLNAWVAAYMKRHYTR